MTEKLKKIKPYMELIRTLVPLAMLGMQIFLTIKLN